MGVIAASPKGPLSPAARQTPIQPGCGGDPELEPGCADEDSCFFPFGEDFGGSCIAETDDPDFECLYGEPWPSPVCGEGPGWGSLCCRVGNLGFGPASWEDLAVPTLYLTGAEYFAGGQHPSERRRAMEHPGRPGSYLLWFGAAGGELCDEADPAMDPDAVWTTTFMHSATARRGTSPSAWSALPSPSSIPWRTGGSVRGRGGSTSTMPAPASPASVLVDSAASVLIFLDFLASADRARLRNSTSPVRDNDAVRGRTR